MTESNMTKQEITKPLPKQSLNLPEGSYIRYKDIYILPIIKKSAQTNVPPLTPKIYPMQFEYTKTLQIIHYPSVLYFIPSKQNNFRLKLSKSALANTVSINPIDEKWFIIGLTNGMVQLKNLDDFQQECYKFEDNQPVHIKWRSEYEVIIGTKDGNLYVMNVERFMTNGKEEATAAPQPTIENSKFDIKKIEWEERKLDSIQCLACQGEYLAVSGNHKLYIFKNLKLIQIINTYFGEFTCIHFVSTNVMAVGGQDDRIHLFYRTDQSWQLTAQCVGHSNFITAIAFDPYISDNDFYRLLSVGEDGNLGFWDIPKKMETLEVELTKRHQVYPEEETLTTIYPIRLQTIHPQGVPLISLLVTPKFVKVLCNQLQMYSFHRPNTFIKET
mmetsp:Transcript_10816/g.15843  ORF Transcript_10816/g.15843 Transcript_10816/m.15843 type:complete len:386 (+) Transcript_10816:66-1223(+)